MTDDRDALSTSSTPGVPPLAPEPESDPFRDTLAAALAPTYVLGRELTGGGMSRVFVAEEPALGRTIVVKVLPLEWAAGMNRDRFQREIQLAARLQHPHIVPLLATGEAAGSMYYTMPYIEGESLRAALARGRRFSVREVVRMLHDVVEALAYAHARGVIHRDVKPGNVLMLGNHALVTDFGVAKALTAARQSSVGPFTPGTTSTGLAIGTPAYMAPEQLAADPAADHRVDIYATGLLAYELLVGVSPFTADSPQATLAAQLTRMPTPLHELRPDVPAAFSALVERCLAKEPSLRPSDAESLLADIEAIVTSSGVPADRPAGGAVGALGSESTPPGTVPVTLPLAAAPADATTAAIAPPSVAPRRRLTGVLGGALLGMTLVLVGGWAIVRGFGGRGAPASQTTAATPAAPPADAPAPVAPPAPAKPVATPVATHLTHDDSLAIAAAVERKFAAEAAKRRETAKPLPAKEADSMRANAWRLYADSARDAAMQIARAFGNSAPPRMPEIRHMVPDSATIAALAAAGAAHATTGYRRFQRPGERPEQPDRPEPAEPKERKERSEFRFDVRGFVPRDIRTEVAISRIGERLPPPKPGVRRVLVLELGDGTGRSDLKGTAHSLTESMRRMIEARPGYEVVNFDVVRDIVHAGVPEAALAAVTHSGAVVSGTLVSYKDSSVSLIALVHDAQRGYPFTFHTPNVSAPAGTPPAAEAFDASVLKALDRVRWVPVTPPAATIPKP